MSGEHARPARDNQRAARPRSAPARDGDAHGGIGNQMLQALLQPVALQCSSSSLGAGPRAVGPFGTGGLAVGPPDDVFEREADDAAEGLMKGRPAAPLSRLRAESPLPRRCLTCDSPMPHAPMARGGLRRKCASCSADLAPKPATPGLDAVTAAVGQRGNGRPLDRSVRGVMERHFGANFSGVTVHQGPEATAANRAVDARAFTAGGDIWLGPDASETDQRLMAHELAHVVQQSTSGGDGTARRIQRVGPADEAFPTPAEREIEKRARQEEEEKERQHAAWEAGTVAHAVPALAGQARTVTDQRGRIGLALTAQRAAVLDAVAGGAGWLNDQLLAQGYEGPALLEVRAAWADAMVAAELLRQDLAAGDVSSESRLQALAAVPAFYGKLEVFAAAVEQAHRAHDDAENARLQADYGRRLANYNHQVRVDKMSQGFAGEPGESGFRAGQALARGSPPDPPTLLTPPPGISGEVAAADGRVTSADSVVEWNIVSEDLKRIGNGFASLVAASLPDKDSNLTGLNYLESLDARLEQFEGQHPLAVRIPALFYPADRMLAQRGPNGEPLSVPESIPWEFYLINTGVTSNDRPATSGGEWVLIDLTSGQRFENRAPASDLDSALLQQGASVDPPLVMFNALNSRLRFPVGRLYFKLPSNQDYVLRTTEPWSLSDWLSAIGMALTAIALVAGVIATGGAAAPAAIAFYAGVGAGAFSIGATIASLQERNEQGVLSGADVDHAAISIGVDLISMVTLGFGRLAGNAAKAGITGERLIFLQRAAQISRGVSLTSNVYQALTATAGFVSAFQALKDQPGLTDEERNRRRGELVRRALLTGVLLTVAIRGDVKELSAGRVVNINHVDPDNVLVPEETVPHGEAEVPHPEAPGASTHAEVAPDVHAQAEEAGAGLRVGPQTHAVGIGGRGRTLDLYFCSNLCTALRARFEAILGTLPRGHPERAIFEDLLRRANGARTRLARGTITQQEADQIAQKLSDDIARHAAAEPLFAALMNTNVEDLVTHAAAIRSRLARDIAATETALEAQAGRQRANRGVNRANDPTAEPAEHSPLETDLLGGVDIQSVDRASRGAQQLKFDAGNFGHTYAEALVDGLPRGLEPEVSVTLPNGSTGRADRVRFIHDADGDRIGAYVYEIKPNTPDQIAGGEVQRQGYVDGLRAEIETGLRTKGKAIPTQAPDGGPLYGGRVMTYDRQRMFAVLRALRANRRDYGLRVSNVDVDAMRAADEAIARQVFGRAGP